MGSEKVDALMLPRPMLLQSRGPSLMLSSTSTIVSPLAKTTATAISKHVLQLVTVNNPHWHTDNRVQAHVLVRQLLLQRIVPVEGTSNRSFGAPLDATFGGVVADARPNCKVITLLSLSAKPSSGSSFTPWRKSGSMGGPFAWQNAA